MRKLTAIMAAAATMAPSPAAARNQYADAEPATAIAPAGETFDGIWRGVIGGELVMACFEGSIGSFYRTADRTLVMLWAEGPLRFAERDERDSGNPRWQLLLDAPDRLGGRRVGGAEAQPLALTRVPAAPEADADGGPGEAPCTTLAYHRERLEPLVALDRPDRPDRLVGTQLVRIEASPPSYPDAVSLRSFRLFGASPAIAAVNALLARAIDLRGPGESAWSMCLIGAGNSGGDFHAALEPVRIGGRFVAAIESREESCGGNHPNSTHYPRLFDLLEGREIAMREWLHPRALAADDLEQMDAAGADAEPNLLPLSPALRRRLLARAAKPGKECAGAMDTATWWTVGVDRTGLRFSPQLGHAERACGEDVLVTFAEMTPFLSPEGKAALAALREDPAVHAPQP